MVNTDTTFIPWFYVTHFEQWQNDKITKIILPLRLFRATYRLHDISIPKNYLCEISDRKFYHRIPHWVNRSRHMRGGFHLKNEKFTIVTVKITSCKKKLRKRFVRFSYTHINLNCNPFHVSLKVMTVAAMTVRVRSRTLSGTSYVRNG